MCKHWLLYLALAGGNPHGQAADNPGGATMMQGPIPLAKPEKTGIGVALVIGPHEKSPAVTHDKGAGHVRRSSK